MDNGAAMSGATHEEGNQHVKGDTHKMDDGAAMSGTTHSKSQKKGMDMDDGMESQ